MPSVRQFAVFALVCSWFVAGSAPPALAATITRAFEVVVTQVVSGYGLVAGSRFDGTLTMPLEFFHHAMISDPAWEGEVANRAYFDDGRVALTLHLDGGGPFLPSVLTEADFDGGYVEHGIAGGGFQLEGRVFLDGEIAAFAFLRALDGPTRVLLQNRQWETIGWGTVVPFYTPLPAAGWAMLAAVGALGVWRRRGRATRP